MTGGLYFLVDSKLKANVSTWSVQDKNGTIYLAEPWKAKNTTGNNILIAFIGNGQK